MSDIESKLQIGFKYFNPFMLLLWRLGLGGMLNMWPTVGGRIMVITHTGRKTGKRRRTPVNYTIVDEDIYCTAGYGETSDWYRNMLANPAVEVWLPDSWWAGLAEDVTGQEGHLTKMRSVLIASGFAARVADIDPNKLDDSQLAEITRSYRLVRIRRTSPRTGPGGPGEFAWLWPVSTMVLLLRMMLPCRRRSK